MRKNYSGSYNKYGNKKVEYKGLKFDSKKELARYQELEFLMLAKGKDKVIDIAPQFKIECIVNGKKVCSYIADFRVAYEDGRIEYEDVKGNRTDVYRLKKKLVEALYPIEIIEI